MKKIKRIPHFKSEEAERDFWATHDTTEYFDLSQPVELDLSKLQPSTESISLRLPQMLLYDLKKLANKKDIAYQALIKVFLAEKVQQEMSRS